MEPIRVTEATDSCHPVRGTSWHPCQEGDTAARAALSVSCESRAAGCR